MIRGRHWTLVVAALERLGCQVYFQDEINVAVARANVRTQTIRKWYVPPAQEQRIVDKLGFDMVIYMATVRLLEVSEA